MGAAEAEVSAVVAAVAEASAVAVVAAADLRPEAAAADPAWLAISEATVMAADGAVDTTVTSGTAESFLDPASTSATPTMTTIMTTTITTATGGTVAGTATTKSQL
jgi:hypothetical protein